MELLLLLALVGYSQTSILKDMTLNKKILIIFLNLVVSCIFVALSVSLSYLLDPPHSGMFSGLGRSMVFMFGGFINFSILFPILYLIMKSKNISQMDKFWRYFVAFTYLSLLFVIELFLALAGG